MAETGRMEYTHTRRTRAVKAYEPGGDIEKIRRQSGLYPPLRDADWEKPVVEVMLLEIAQ